MALGITLIGYSSLICTRLTNTVQRTSLSASYWHVMEDFNLQHEEGVLGIKAFFKIIIMWHGVAS